MNKIKNITLIFVLGTVWLALTVFAWVKPVDSYSDSERRGLEAFPELTWETIISGDFMSDFEAYTLDQFPMRDSFRSLKALSSAGVFLQLENNDVYIHDGYISKIEYPKRPVMMDYAADRFSFIYNTYLKDNCENIYFSIVPDKNYFLADESGRLSIDYEEFIREMIQKADYMDYIDILPLLSIDDYYLTDTHWRQENIIDVAEKLASAMGVTIDKNFVVNELSDPFYGVYYGQAALPVKPDTLKYLTSDILSGCTVTNYSLGKPETDHIYNMDKANGKDPYEMFLSGSTPLIVIDNPNAETDKELILFRDSFGSSLAPLLVSGYSKITVVDIRYVNSTMLGGLIDFDGQDVLFMYSTLLLNNSTGLK